MHARSGASRRNDDELADLIAECRSDVERICRSRLSGLPEADIEETIQEAYLQLIAADRSRIRNIRAWVIRVTVITCAHVYRRRYRMPEESLDDAPPIVDSPDPSATANASMWLLSAVDTLSTADRLLLSWLYVEGLSSADVAERLNITSGHVRVLAFRARARARIAFEELT